LTRILGTPVSMPKDASRYVQYIADLAVERRLAAGRVIEHATGCTHR
jgi:hypothetical protein